MLCVCLLFRGHWNTTRHEGWVAFVDETSHLEFWQWYFLDGSICIHKNKFVCIYIYKCVNIYIYYIYRRVFLLSRFGDDTWLIPARVFIGLGQGKDDKSCKFQLISKCSRTSCKSKFTNRSKLIARKLGIFLQAHGFRWLWGISCLEFRFKKQEAVVKTSMMSGNVLISFKNLSLFVKR